MPEIRFTGTEILVPNNNDLFLLQSENGSTNRIKYSNFLSQVNSQIGTLTNSVNSLNQDAVFKSSLGQINGVATLGSDGKVPGNQLPTISSSGSSLSAWKLITSNYTAVAGDRLRVNASNGNVVITLPASPSSNDADIWIQRLDTSVNRVLLRCAPLKFANQVGRDGVFSPSTIALSERVSYIDANIGYLPQDNQLTYQPAPGYGTALTWVSNGDANGLFNWFGTNGLTQSWVNPTTNNRCRILASSTVGGVVTDLTNRQASSWWTQSTPNSWVAFDFNTNESFSLSDYIIQTRNGSLDTNNYPRNWVIQGTNSVATWDVTGVNNANWTTIDTRSNQTQINGLGQWFRFVLPQVSGAFRYLRFLQTGLTSSSENFLCLGEIEFYGIKY